MAADADAERLALLALFDDAQAAGAVVCTRASEDAGTSVDEEQEPSAARPAHAHARLAGGKPPRSAPAARAVCVLTAEQAVTIFLARKERKGKRGTVANRLACRYGVAPRTVRDIWNLRTWTETTRPLWSSADFARAAKKESMKRECAPPAARAALRLDAAHGEWKLCAAWLTPGEEWERDEFDYVLDHILASARSVQLPAITPNFACQE